MIPTRRTASACLALALIVGVPTSGGPAEAADPGRRMWRTWTELELKAGAALFLTGRVALSDRTTGDARTIATSTRARFLGATIARSETETRIDAKTGRTLSFVEIQPRRARRYTFGPESYRVEKLKPGEAGAEAPLERWDVVWSAEYPFAGGPTCGDAPIYDVFSLLLRLGELPLDRRDADCAVWVATSDGPQAYRIRLGARERAVRRIAVGPDARPRDVPVDEAVLLVDAVDPEKADETFLGMKGETEIRVEADSRTLLGIEGKVPGVPGRVVLAVDALR